MNLVELPRSQNAFLAFCHANNLSNSESARLAWTVGKARKTSWDSSRRAPHGIDWYSLHPTLNPDHDDIEGII